MSKAKKAAPKAAKKPAAKRARKPAGGPTFKVAEVYGEIVSEAGIVRVEPGHHVVTYPDKTVAVMPPEVFADRHPEL